MRTAISIDRKYLVIRDDEAGSWDLCLKDAEGIYRKVDTWNGNRRSLYRRLEMMGVVPSRDADIQLAEIPEQSAFRADEPLPGAKAREEIIPKRRSGPADVSEV